MSKNSRYRITFKGQPYLLIGSIEGGGAIATPEQFAKFIPSHAYLLEDGRVVQNGTQIGTRADVEVLSEATDIPVPDMLAALDNVKEWPPHIREKALGGILQVLIATRSARRL